MNIDKFLYRIERFLGIFIVFSFFMDSGGGAGIRVIGFIFCILFLLNDFLRKRININAEFLVIWIFIASYITITIAFSLSDGVPITNAIKFNFSLYFLLVLYVLAKNHHITISDFMNAGTLFGLVILIFFFGDILNISLIKNVQEIFVKSFSGLYGKKPIFNNILDVVYFEGTLNLVIPAIYFLYKNRKINFLVVFAALAVSLSRFGVFVCLIGIFLRIIDKFSIFMRLLCVIIFCVVIILFYENLYGTFSSGDGFDIRFGHFQGIKELFDDNYMIFLFGQGPGTSFYSYGFYEYTDSIEISQLDFLRKYGIVFSVILTLLFAYFLKKLYFCKKGRPFCMAVILFYIVALSNPVLLSLPFMTFFAICIVQYEISKQHNQFQWVKFVH